jgi:hypothetical protein
MNMYYAKNKPKPNIKPIDKKQLDDWYDEYQEIETQLYHKELDKEFEEEYKKEKEKKEKVLQELQELPKLTEDYVNKKSDLLRQQQQKQQQKQQQQWKNIKDNVDIKKLELDSLLSKLPLKKQQYFKLLFELNDYENDIRIKQYNEIERRIKLVKDNDITVDKTEYKKMRELLTKYKELLNITPSSISSLSSSISPKYYEYKELKSSPNDLIKKIRKMKIKTI